MKDNKKSSQLDVAVIEFPHVPSHLCLYLCFYESHLIPWPLCETGDPLNIARKKDLFVCTGNG